MQKIGNTTINQEYKSRINKVFDYIDRNLSSKISLEEIAEVANFSKYHFNRIFGYLVGETPFQFINRLRLEKAASMLITSPNKTVTEISEFCGFSDSAIFARYFKNHFKMSATDWKSKNKDCFSNISQILSNYNQTHSNKQQNEIEITSYFCTVTNKLKWKSVMKILKEAEVKKLPEMTVAYVRYVGPYKGNAKLFEGLFNKIFSWAGSKGLLQQPDFKTLCVYHDSPEITDEDKLRTSVCVTVPEDTKVEGEIGKMKIEGGDYLVGKFEVNSQEFQQAWELIFAKILPQSGYQPDDKPCFEMYPEPHENGIFKVEICIPVKPL